MTDTLERREAIARIIDPRILWGEDPDGTTDHFVKRQAAALTKADAILALTPSPRVDEGRAREALAATFEQAGILPQTVKALRDGGDSLFKDENLTIRAMLCFATEAIATNPPADTRVGKLEAELRAVFAAGFHAAEKALGFEGCDESEDALEIEWGEFRATLNTLSEKG